MTFYEISDVNGGNPVGVAIAVGRAVVGGVTCGPAAFDRANADGNITGGEALGIAGAAIGGAAFGAVGALKGAVSGFKAFRAIGRLTKSRALLSLQQHVAMIFLRYE